MGSACAFVSHGVGIAIVNRIMAREYLWRGIEIRPFQPPMPHRYAFVTSAAAPMARVTAAFLDHCRASFREMMDAEEIAELDKPVVSG